ncbi:MAG: hypothetical protein PVJ39_04350 [Gammaproteobacteria bacterium]|jgi:hypothetical protein
MDAINRLPDRYPWGAIHEAAIRTTATYLGVELERVWRHYDEKILAKIAKDQLSLPHAA